ncbi:flavodoxin domain-containing protein [Georgenia satyanarayanai]|uniref:flavodoxin domain-containing protein n=1 Tax=Georgenia satyanarayanai TaxID=860221 RepID=UPI0012645A31|nr:flavodoxin domain-containing protein [Georgenia satyanarayanai]
MDVVVVYETHFGQTREIAAHIADGARETGAAAVVVAVDHATREQVDGADLLVVGGPTHVRGMSRPWSRERLHAQELGTHGEIAAGVREWLAGLPAASAGKHAAAFDTRLPSALAGGAARGVAHGLREHGFSLVAAPEGFLVEEADGPLREGEPARARAWGAQLVTALADAQR